MGILERLADTACRLRSLLSGVERADPVDAGWTIAQEVGHPIDPEPLWLTPAHDVASGYAALSVLPANREVLTVILVGAVLIVAHVALLGLASLGRLPLAAVAGVLSVVALKYA